MGLGGLVREYERTKCQENPKVIIDQVNSIICQLLDRLKTIKSNLKYHSRYTQLQSCEPLFSIFETTKSLIPLKILAILLLVATK